MDIKIDKQNIESLKDRGLAKVKTFFGNKKRNIILIVLSSLFVINLILGAISNNIVALMPEMAGAESQKYRKALQGYGKPIYTEEEYLQEKAQRKTEDFVITIIENPYFAKQFITTKRHIGAAGICDYWKQLKSFLESGRSMFHEE